ncbi:extensin family protein [Hyphomicrobium sp. CS1GBMeth3]|uniref:extensin-like domain-containing protein n=1 Tax=Hyphomicrobium sp. CS1GBMeth3 TaxID=1892845 RepID=UPI0009309096|nr:extensin family protein [Hyphomicrobium sp. CS1GBMeth3]
MTLAREQCMHLLAGVPAEFDYLEPVKKGQCGLPAPVRLKSVGSGATRVKFSPPVQVNCRMVAALAGWTKSTLQPEARARFKSDVTGILGASGYVCRNIYHRPNGRLSQHALANAIDIGAFSLANGRTIRVLRGWGLTARDIKAQAEARAKAEAKEKAKSKAASANEAVAESKAATSKKDAMRGGKQDRLVTQASLAVSEEKAGTGDTASKKADPAPDAKSAKPTKEALFLRAIHGGACDEFGTVLGPEANDPHRDHFHLDLIPRRGRGYCR